MQSKTIRVGPNLKYWCDNQTSPLDEASYLHFWGFLFKKINMSKDPAFLFYSSDFLTGTMFMTDEQVGKYIRLLCAQHQKTKLSEKDMLKICGSHDEDVFSKFQKDSEGFFYNERLKQETEKRNAYSESRRNNRLKKDNISKTHEKDMSNTCESYVQHMENENENEIRNIDDNENKKVLSKIEIPDENEFITYCEQYLTNIGKNARLYENVLRAKYASWVDQKWKDGNGKKITNWKVKIQNTIPYLKPEYDKPVQVNQPVKKTMLEAQMQTIEAAQILIEKYNNIENDPNALRR